MAEGSATPLARGRTAVAPDEVPEDCTSCGACCFSTRDDYIELFAADRERLDEHARGYTLRRGGRHFMRFAEGRCSALDVEGGARCRIYPQRPDACRWLGRGTGACREQIAQKREIALLCIRRPTS